MLNKINILDIGLGNINSVYNAFCQIHSKVQIVTSLDSLASSSGIVLPGNGSFFKAMENIKVQNLTKSLVKMIKNEKVPFLGICVGMQILFEDGFEVESCKGLGLIPGNCQKILNRQNIKNFRLPHIGWNTVSTNDHNSKLFKNLGDNVDLYFLNSYRCELSIDLQSDFKRKPLYSEVTYGEKFMSSIESENISAVQFHPEKSHENGLYILNNWINSH
tara:strand:- start:22121 stop:22774 length:654 start_codon:yes stop_codon:yes gene_type:complete